MQKRPTLTVAAVESNLVGNPDVLVAMHHLLLPILEKFLGKYRMEFALKPQLISVFDDLGEAVAGGGGSEAGGRGTGRSGAGGRVRGLGGPQSASKR